MHTYPDSFVSANIFLLINVPSTRIRRKRKLWTRKRLKTLSRVELFENAIRIRVDVLQPALKTMKRWRKSMKLSLTPTTHNSILNDLCQCIGSSNSRKGFDWYRNATSWKIQGELRSFERRTFLGKLIAKRAQKLAISKYRKPGQFWASDWEIC
jgi:hypothetical protein